MNHQHNHNGGRSNHRSSSMTDGRNLIFERRDLTNINGRGLNNGGSGTIIKYTGTEFRYNTGRDVTGHPHGHGQRSHSLTAGVTPIFNREIPINGITPISNRAFPINGNDSISNRAFPINGNDSSSTSQQRGYPSNPTNGSSISAVYPSGSSFATNGWSLYPDRQVVPPNGRGLIQAQGQVKGQGQSQGPIVATVHPFK